MSESAPGTWIPASCTLPDVEKPLRSAEFAELVRQSARAGERLRPTELLVTLAAEPQVAARVADLAVREVRCCGFFTFAVEISERGLALRITVPPAHVGVLDALTASVPA